jgi:hypothetical protein
MESHTLTITLTDDEVRFLVMLLTKVHAEIDADTGSGVVPFAANDIDPGILKTLAAGPRYTTSPGGDWFAKRPFPGPVP